jgi:hypothetical protein
VRGEEKKEKKKSNNNNDDNTQRNKQPHRSTHTHTDLVDGQRFARVAQVRCVNDGFEEQEPVVAVADIHRRLARRDLRVHRCGQLGEVGRVVRHVLLCDFEHKTDGTEFKT